MVLRPVCALLLLPVPLLLLLFPHGSFAPGRLGSLAKLSLALTITLPLALLVAPARIVSPARHLSGRVDRLDLDKLSLPLGDTVTRGLLMGSVACVVVAYLATFTSVAIRRARARGADRQRYDWLVWAALVDVAVFSFGLLVKDSSWTTPGLVLATWATAGAVSIGVVRPAALDIDRLLSVTIVYGLLSAVFVGIDLGALGVGTLLLGDRLATRDVTLAVLVVAVVGYGPLREALRRSVRRLLVGEREDRYAVVAGLASRLERTTSAEEQLAEVTAAVARTFGVAYVQMQVLGPTGERTTVTQARPRRRCGACRSSSATRRWATGAVTVGLRTTLRPRPRAAGRRGTPGGRGHAEPPARRAAAGEPSPAGGCSGGGATTDPRDLHDGLGPALGSVVLRLDLARNVLAPVPAEADALLVQSREDVRAALVDLRRLVHGLRPPALDDLGLVGAIRHEVGKVSGTLEVNVVPRGAARPGCGGGGCGLPHHLRGTGQRRTALRSDAGPGVPVTRRRHVVPRRLRRRDRDPPRQGGRGRSGLDARTRGRARWLAVGDLPRAGHTRRGDPAVGGPLMTSREDPGRIVDGITRSTGKAWPRCWPPSTASRWSPRLATGSRRWRPSPSTRRTWW